MSSTEQKRIIPNHDGVSDCRKFTCKERKEGVICPDVELEGLLDADVMHFLQKHGATFTKRYHPNSFVTHYEITIKVKHEKLGSREFYTGFYVRGGYVTQADALKAFDAQLRVACAILHWEILCWEKPAFNINGTLSSRG